MAMNEPSPDRRRIDPYLSLLKKSGATFELHEQPAGIERNEFKYSDITDTSLKMTAPGDTEVRIPLALIEFICERDAAGGVIRLTRRAALVRGCII